MAAAEAQLTTAVQGKLDSLKHAEDLMDESTDRLEKFGVVMEKVLAG